MARSRKRPTPEQRRAQADALDAVVKARKRHLSAERAWKKAIVHAYETGLGVREIADAVGVTHPNILYHLRAQGAAPWPNAPKLNEFEDWVATVISGTTTTSESQD